jgi:hypothetical protein
MISGARVNPVATDKLLVLSTGRRVLRAAAGSCFARTTRISSPPASGPPKRGMQGARIRHVQYRRPRTRNQRKACAGVAYG